MTLVSVTVLILPSGSLRTYASVLIVPCVLAVFLAKGTAALPKEPRAPGLAFGA
jgi:hypothetical protein